MPRRGGLCGHAGNHQLISAMTELYTSDAAVLHWQPPGTGPNRQRTFSPRGRVSYEGAANKGFSWIDARLTWDFFTFPAKARVSISQPT